MSPLPAETPLTDKEQDFLDNSPPGLWPENQDSYFGQLRLVLTTPLQETYDLLGRIWLNLDASTADIYLANWEEQLGLPVNPTDATTEERHARLTGRLHWGPFTRTKRRVIVEAFIIATFGAAIELTPDGVPLTAGGVPLYSGEFDLTGLYNIVENITNFSYDVRIKNTITVDDGMTRELDRITPAHISWTLTYTATP